MKEIKLEINNKEYVVNIESFGAYEAKVKVNNRTYDVKLKDLGLEDAIPVAFTPTAGPVQMAPAGGGVAPAAPQAVASSGSGTPIAAPMPGLVVSIKVKIGDSIKEGQTLMVMEAMKMENNIDAPSTGSVKGISVKEGDNVSEGDVLITIG